ncbi:MAG: M48 family metallopeptidase [Planctomycetota bacterium]|nr:M48 family metallopeptidase [Planctomycetota bacterium]
MRYMLRGFFVLLLTLLTSCQTWRQLNFYSDAELASIGAEAFAQVLNDGNHKVISSGDEYEMVQRVGQRIAVASGTADDPNYQWEFKLLKADDIPNAFCLPGGKVAVYTGILPITLNEDGLAAVLGHEVAHATQHHGGIRMSQAAITSSILVVAGAGISITGMTDLQKVACIGALGAAINLGVTLPFSREHETEADLIGIRFSIRAGYDPWEAPKLWERMAEISSGVPSWLSTHPNPLDRAAELKEAIPQIIKEERPNAPATKVAVVAAQQDGVIL